MKHCPKCGYGKVLKCWVCGKGVRRKDYLGGYSDIGFIEIVYLRSSTFKKHICKDCWNAFIRIGLLHAKRKNKL